MGITSDPIQDRMGSWPRNVTASWLRAYLISREELSKTGQHLNHRVPSPSPRGLTLSYSEGLRCPLEIFVHQAGEPDAPVSGFCRFCDVLRRGSRF